MTEAEDIAQNIKKIAVRGKSSRWLVSQDPLSQISSRYRKPNLKMFFLFSSVYTSQADPVAAS